MIDLKEQRRAVIVKWARLRPSGRPVFCIPSKAEREGLVGRKQSEVSDGKVIYDSRTAAEACAADMAALGGRWATCRAYQCARSRTGHWHLTHGVFGRRGSR